MPALLVYTIACMVYGGILSIVLLPPLYRLYIRHAMTRAATRILDDNEKSHV